VSKHFEQTSQMFENSHKQREMMVRVAESVENLKQIQYIHMSVNKYMPRTFRLNDNEIKTSSLHGSIKAFGFRGG